ncbi:MAG: biosynthetic-type acetolactate synthase large subunit [Treponema sp.]|jgi:acetolactate synthase-1/2/3 large subunit|nr:biosynthetic-type acetolactate synthase large subunit [Treponema sp.]
MKVSGARILIETLIEEGVDTIFGFPGGAVLFIYDELYKQRDRIRHILVSHEQHAAHAADGYARSSGKVGVCLATSGPGATNLITGIATAYMDSVPLVAITGNVATGLLGKDSFQEVDATGISMPIVKHNWIVKDVRALAETVRDAFAVARSGRPGPVLIDIPKDVTALEAEWTPGRAQDAALSARARRLAARNARVTFRADDIDRAAALLLSAKRPLLYAGGGVIISGASEELGLLAERLNAPVALSLMGIGAMPQESRLCTGLIGMHGTVASNKAAQKADLLVAIGARFSDRVTSRTDMFAKTARVLQFDIDPAEINKNIATTDRVIGDVKAILQRLLEKLPPAVETAWGSEIEQWKTHIPHTHKGAERGPGLHPRFVITETAKALGPELIACTDVGQHQIWAAQFFPASRPRSFLSSGGLGTMGFGLGAALGAKTANPARPVVLFTGDGSFRMNCAELATLVSRRIPILIVIFDNHTLGMVRQWQNFFYESRYAETDLPPTPDFIRLAEAYGAAGWRADSRESFSAALAAAQEALAAGRPALIDAQIDIDEKVLPMVPSGKPIDEQIL